MDRVIRFKGPERFAHWLHALTFTVLLGTGMVLYIPGLRAFATGEAGEAARMVHRLAALIFIFCPLIDFFFSRAEFFESLREIVHWGRDDLTWLRGAWAYYTHGRTEQLPPQGKFNAGQKLNALAQFVAFWIFVVTGMLMWFDKGIVPASVFRGALLLHDLAVIATVTLFLVHLYLVGVHPATRQSMTAMVDGSVSEAYAREHHRLWLETQRKEEESDAAD